MSISKVKCSSVERERERGDEKRGGQRKERERENII
jgi:hypothetical protein